MARQLFISQDTLSTWQDQDKVAFDGQVMTIKADGRRFTLLEAVRFIHVEGEGQDSAALIGKVKTAEQLASLDAERYRDSVILGEVAYKVQEGFIGEVFVRSGVLDQECAPAQTGTAAVGTVSAVPSPPVPAEPPAAAAARRSAAAVAKDGEREPKAAVLRVPLRRKEQDTARTQPSLPIIPEPAAPGSPSAAKPCAEAPGAAARKDGEAQSSDEDLLTKFLLENL